jgi:hypothetical protein
MDTYTIEINEEVESIEDMAIVLERISELILQGYLSGIEPSWSIEKIENQ